MLYINVPFSDKDEAKALGAKWNANDKTWYVEKSVDYKKFAKWIIGNREEDLSIICDDFYVVESHRVCYKCGKITRVIGFSVEKWYDVISVNCDYTRSRFIFNKEFASIQSHLDFLPTEFYTYLSLNYNYKKGYSKTTRSSYFANHCDCCGAIQGEFYLFAEPSSPFFIDSPEKARQLTFYKYKLSHDRIVYDSIPALTSSDSDDIRRYSNFVKVINYDI